MPRYSRSRSRSRSKKAKKSRSSSRDRKNRYVDRERSRSRDRHKKKKERDRSHKRKKHSRDTRDRHYSSSRSRSQSKVKERSRSKSTAPTQTFVQERFNFSEAVSVLDQRGKDAIDEINKNEFEAKSFTTTATTTTTTTTKKLPEKVKIDLKNETITLQKIEHQEPEEDPLIHPTFLGDEEERMRRWVRKLYQYRQRKINETNL